MDVVRNTYENVNYATTCKSEVELYALPSLSAHPKAEKGGAHYVSMDNEVNTNKKNAVALFNFKKAIFIISSCIIVIFLILVVALAIAFATFNQVRILEASLRLLQSRLEQQNAFASVQFNATSANLNSLVNAQAELYRGCYKDTATCRVTQDVRNPYWYYCITSFMRANVTVSDHITLLKDDHYLTYI